ncbi:MAG: cation:proton antiporter [bacterium]|nr:cation:proton antiporter [bacterium]
MNELVQLTLIWASALAAVGAARATRMTPVVYYLGAGAVLVNLGWLSSDTGPFIRGLSELGIILIMFALGFEESAGNFLRSIRRSWGIAFFGALFPFLVAFGVAYGFWRDAQIAVMCGLTMTATAVSLTMVSLRSEGLHQSPVATRVMTAAVLDDIASLALIAVVIPLVTEGGASVGALGVGWILAKAVLFFVVVTIFGAWVFPDSPSGWVSRVPLLGNRGLRHLLRMDRGEHAVLQVLLLALGSALFGHLFGFHPAVGAYMAGLVVAREHFFDGHEQGSYADTKRIVDNVAFSWIGPVFFVNLGAHLEFDAELLVGVIPHVFAMTLGVMVFQIASASLAARYTSGMRPAASLMIGFGMLGRAELAFVVMDIAYVQHGILSTEAFYTLMVSCFWLNIAVPLAIHWWKPRYERERALTA